MQSWAAKKELMQILIGRERILLKQKQRQNPPGTANKYQVSIFFTTKKYFRLSEKIVSWLVTTKHVWGKDSIN